MLSYILKFVRIVTQHSFYFYNMQPVLSDNIIYRRNLNCNFPIFACTPKKYFCKSCLIIIQRLFFLKMIYNRYIIQRLQKFWIAFQQSKIIFYCTIQSSIQYMNQPNIIQNISSIKSICFQIQCSEIYLQSFRILTLSLFNKPISIICKCYLRSLLNRCSLYQIICNKCKSFINEILFKFNTRHIK